MTLLLQQEKRLWLSVLHLGLDGFVSCFLEVSWLIAAHSQSQ